MPDSSTPNDIRARLRELGYLQNPLDRFVFGGGTAGGALKLALGAGLRGAMVAGPLLGGFGIILLGSELAPSERLPWFVTLSLLSAIPVLAWVVIQALLIHAFARRRGRSYEGLPVMILILAGAGLLLPAAVWLVLSGHIHSTTLGAGLTFPLLAAVALLIAASLTIFLATRAADLYAAERFDILASSRRGGRSLFLGLVLAGLIGGVLWKGRNPQQEAIATPVTINPDPVKNRGVALRIIAVDGVHAGELATALKPNSVRLTDFPAAPELIAGWLKIQSGHKDWHSQSLSGYRAVWGGRNHASNTAPGRMLERLRAFRISHEAPLPGKFSRPLFFWEVPSLELPSATRVRVIGGWHTYPSSGRADELVSERAYFALLDGQSAAPVCHVPYTWLHSPDDIFRQLPPAPSGLQLDEFHRVLSAPQLKAGSKVLPPRLIWVYLPGADIVCAKSPAQCELAKQKNRDFLSSLGDAALLLIENPGRQGGTGAIWFQPVKNESIRPVHAPEELAAAVLDYLGYPLAADLAGVKPEEAQLPTYGRITIEDPSGATDDATLKALKSLGYLQ